MIWGHLGWVDLLDIFCVWLIVYRVLLFIKGTGAVQILAGLGIVAIAYITSIWLELDTLNWMLEQFFNNLFLIVVILFQAEIRRALAHIGKNPFFSGISANKEGETIDEICQGLFALADRGHGALVVLEREIGLENYIERGVQLDSQVSSELIQSIFHPSSPLHDGAAIVRGGRLVSAGSFLPLSRNPNIAKVLGTRHRAGMGVSEETDAIVLIVSEENRNVNLSVSGEIQQNMTYEALRQTLYRAFEVEVKQVVPKNA